MKTQPLFPDFKTAPGMVYWNLLKPIALARLTSFKDDFLTIDRRQFSNQKVWDKAIWAVRRAGTDLLNASLSLYTLDSVKNPFELLAGSSPQKFGEIFYPGLAITSGRNEAYYLLQEGRVNPLSAEQAKAQVVLFGEAVFQKLMHEAREADRKFYDKHSHKLRG